jgi:uncharacterized membrane protein YbaN (DUF454 family)
MSTGAVRRTAWTGLGLLSVALGGLGIIVPGLPTTVFFIVAASCFARSSPRLERWVLNLPAIGRMVRDYRAGLGMPRRAKAAAILAITLFAGLAVFLADVAALRIVIAAAGAAGIAVITFRVPTREHVLASAPRA